jgi:uncharacterized lipoprotein YmbA
MVIGCRSNTSPAVFYTLNALARMEAEHPEQGPDPGIAIGIGPVQFPQFLKRPQIVTRSGPNRLAVSEFHRWGGDLDQDFLRVLAENISILMPTNRVVTFPWKGQADPAYWIVFDVQRFDGQPGDSLVLNLTWTIRERGSTKVLEARRSNIQQPVPGEDYDALVSAHSLALEQLSHEIAGAIHRVSQKDFEEK